MLLMRGDVSVNVLLSAAFFASMSRLWPTELTLCISEIIENGDVVLDEDTVWLTQIQIIELFDSSKANVSEHIKNVFISKELDKSNCSGFPNSSAGRQKAGCQRT